MSGFAADWLQRREPFDAAARDVDLARAFAAALGDGHNGTCRLVDLAAGSGSSFRALAPLIGRDQDWLLVDHDRVLIDAQRVEIARWATRNGWACEALNEGLRVRAGTAHWRVRSQTLDLANALEEVDLPAFDGVTTSAFLDLVSTAWLERLCDLVTRSGVPLLATLTVDGRREWHPSLPSDARLKDAFGRHQVRDKGFGPAHGPLAAGFLAERLRAHDYAVTIARSDWRIDADARDMLRQLVEESASAASETEPAAARAFAEWSATRRAQIESGTLSLHVGHVDVLAVSRLRVRGKS